MSKHRHAPSRRANLRFAIILAVSAATTLAAPSLASSGDNIANVGNATATTISEVVVDGPRISASELLSGAASSDIDLGPAPPAGGSRLFERSEIESLLVAAHAPVPPRLPVAVRVILHTHTLDAHALEEAGRRAFAALPPPAGVTLKGVRPPRSVVIPAAALENPTLELPRLSRRTGPLPVTATLVFAASGSALVTRVPLSLDLALDANAARPDVGHGGPVTLVIRRGGVEISTSATAGADGFIGAALPVVIHPSGRILQARLVDAHTAVAIESP